MELDERRNTTASRLKAAIASVKHNEKCLAEVEQDLEAIEQDMGPEALAEIKKELENERKLTTSV